MRRITFIDKAVAGHQVDIQDEIARWNYSSDPSVLCELYEFLGMTKDDFEKWAENPAILPEIIASYKFR